MKTLEKNRNRRYDSVSEFAADIRRYLNNEPVLVGPPSATYRIKKFVKRHQVLVAASTTVVVVVIIGLVISTSLYLSMRKALNTVSQLEDKFEVYSKLSTVQKLYSEGRSQAALDEIESILNSQNLGPEAHLLKARLLIEVGQLKEADTNLLPLTKAEPHIAGAAHYLLAQLNMSVDIAKVKEHEALAAAILPEKADAYALRAMTASSMEQALQWLDRAITLDPTHYPSRKARMLIYYIQGQDQKMVEDVAAFIALRPADSLGYTIRGILRRESGRFEEALADHTHAIELCESEKELIEAYEQRYETYTQIGDHSAALEDAVRLAELSPDEFWHRFRIVTSLIALKDFTAAQQEYRAIVQTSYQWDRKIRRNLVYHVFDILGAGQTFKFPPDITQKAPFAQIQRVSECYYTLASKATHFPLPRQGVIPYAWSPDGKQLLYGWWGLYGALRQIIEGAVPTISEYAGLKIIDIESGEERFVTKAHGGIPSWSPDGRYIAYTGPDQNLYIFSVENNQSRKIASAFWTQWSNDSQHLYYKANLDWDDIYSIVINDPHAIPKKLMRCPGSFAICESENWIAFGKPTGIDLLDLSSGSILYQCPSIWPQDGWALSLSPNGRELAFTSWYPHVDVGPFILDTQYKKLYRVLDYPVDKFIWSPDGSKLAIGAKRDIWIMDIDPNIPTFQILGKPVSENELIAEEIARKSQSIEVDPLYPENYLRRALVYMSIGQYEMAEPDLQQFDTLATSDDHHVGYEIFWWLKQCYTNDLYESAEILVPYAENLIKRFPKDVPSYHNIIVEIVEHFERIGKTELAAKWIAILKDFEEKDM
jgi:tetratricopeptide (TPR) repeat protein